MYVNFNCGDDRFVKEEAEEDNVDAVILLLLPFEEETEAEDVAICEPSNGGASPISTVRLCAHICVTLSYWLSGSRIGYGVELTPLLEDQIQTNTQETVEYTVESKKNIFKLQHFVTM